MTRALLLSIHSRRAGALALFASFAFAACGGAPANYPDKSDVVAAQAAWCQSLAKIEGAGDGWEHMADCKDVYPTASSAYLRGMTKCFSERLQSEGNDAPDKAQVIADCTDEVMVKMPGDEASGREIIEARCQRMQRCESVPVDECKTAVMKLEASQRALFTITYNGAALHEIADCLASSSCSSDDEEAARDACYKPAAEKLLWFPGG